MGTFTEPDSKVLFSDAIDSPMPDDKDYSTFANESDGHDSWKDRIVCRICKYYVNAENMGRHLRKKHGLTFPRNTDLSEYMMSIPDFIKARKKGVLTKNQEMQREMKARLLAIYGSKCLCCGESNPQFLTLDHIQNDGTAERKSGLGTWGVLRKAIREKDKTRYQILCYNCNFGRAKNRGICPHQKDMAFQLKKAGETIANHILAIKKTESDAPLPPKNKYDMSCR